MKTKDLFNLLIENGIKNSNGHIDFSFMNHNVRVKTKSSVGYVFQDWLEDWLKNKGIKFSKNTNSQDWPDFFLDPSKDNIKGLVEIKTFDAKEGPNFDIANFDAYTRSIKTNAYRLDADYLIFCYDLDKKGNFYIKNMWLKKVWEISSSSGKFPIRCQVKQDVIVNIRPARWFSTRLRYGVFSSRRDYVNAISNTLLSYATRSSLSQNWLQEVMSDYMRHTGQTL